MSNQLLMNSGEDKMSVMEIDELDKIMNELSSHCQMRLLADGFRYRLDCMDEKMSECRCVRS